MNTLTFLSPPIERIERDLFGVSDTLIEAVIAGHTSPDLAASVRQSPEWAAYHAGLDAGFEEEAAELPVPDPDSIVVPEFLQQLFRQRVDAHNSLARERTPAPGQIVQVCEIKTPQPGQLDPFMQEPLYVLLDRPTATAEVWHGWLASHETDYASAWDFVLQQEDLPYDPQVAMIQAWNPVQLYLPMAGRVFGRLSPARLQAVRALAEEHKSGVMDLDVVRPGHLACREVGEFSMVTGSALGGPADPRYRYQQLYHRAAEAIRQPARLALAATRQPSLAERLQTFVERLRASVDDLLCPVPQVALAMSGDADRADDLVWPGRARIHPQRIDEDGSGNVEIRALQVAPIICTLKVEGRVHQTTTLHKEGDLASFAWDGDAPTVLELQASRYLLALPLS